MRFVFVSTPTFERWDWKNPDEKGIGGSETSHIEMARRLAEHGHEVVSFSPVPFGGVKRGPGGVMWSSSDSTDPATVSRVADSTPSVWIVYRDPEFAKRIPREAGPVWLICQDIDYMGLNARQEPVERPFSDRIDRIVALCESQAKYLRREHAPPRVCVSSNGIKAELVREVLAEADARRMCEHYATERNAKRLIYASSPDRGLLNLIGIFQRAQELVPDLELHVYYGFNNMEIFAEKPNVSPVLRDRVRNLKAAIEVSGVYMHGRLSQPDLAREWVKAGIWCQPTTFTETSCITCMDAQAYGAIPIATPVWAVGENVKHGVFIDGDPENDPLVRARFAFEIARMASDPDRQQRIREKMMPDALARFDWENFVRQWEGWAIQDVRHEFRSLPNVDATAPAVYRDQFEYQRSHARGRILNVGCNEDGANLGRDFHAVNLDVAAGETDAAGIVKPWPVSMLGDARDLPFSRPCFDTVVLSEILEHMERPDGVQALREARRVLLPGGRVLITIPHDGRRETGELPIPEKEFYAPGVHAYHYRLITYDEFLEWMAEAGLEVADHGVIRYPWGEVGSGIVGLGIAALQVPEPCQHKIGETGNCIECGRMLEGVGA